MYKRAPEAVNSRIFPGEERRQLYSERVLDRARKLGCAGQASWYLLIGGRGGLRRVIGCYELVAGGCGGRLNSRFSDLRCFL